MHTRIYSPYSMRPIFTSNMQCNFTFGIEVIVLTYMLSGHYQTILKLFLEETLTSPAPSSGALVQIFTVSIVRVLNH